MGVEAEGICELDDLGGVVSAADPPVLVLLVVGPGDEGGRFSPPLSEGEVFCC